MGEVAGAVGAAGGKNKGLGETVEGQSDTRMLFRVLGILTAAKERELAHRCSYALPPVLKNATLLSNLFQVKM